MYVPHTPAGTMLVHLKATTPEKAWAALLEDAAHMPYKNVQAFVDRGYTVCPVPMSREEYDAAKAADNSPRRVRKHHEALNRRYNWLRLKEPAERNSFEKAELAALEWAFTLLPDPDVRRRQEP